MMPVLISMLLGAQQGTPNEPARGQAEQGTNKSREAKEQQPKPPPKIEVQNRPEIKSTDDTQVEIDVKQFKITGVTVFSPDELRALVADGEGKKQNLAQIKAQANRITLYYKQRGYDLAFAYVPEQKIKDGIVEISVLEGWFDKVLVGGNRHYTEKFILERLSLAQGRPAAMDDLERDLLKLNNYPGLKVGATLRPGEKFGATDLYLNVQDAFPISASVDYDNFGSKAISENRMGATVQAFNLFEIGHSLSVRGMIGSPAENLVFARVGYTIPMSSGLTFDVSWSRYQYNGDRTFVPLEPNGTGDTYSFMASYPVLQNRSMTLSFELGFEAKEIDQRLSQTITAQDKLRVIVAGVEFEWTDEWWGRWVALVQARQGIADFLGGLKANDPNASRLAAGGGFTRGTLQINRIQKIQDWAYLILKFTGQYTEESVVVSETFGLGGYDSVRGYPSFQFTGDRGYSWTAELRVTPSAIITAISESHAKQDNLWHKIFQDFQIATFFDMGEGFIVTPAPGQRREDVLAGAGVGIRYSFSTWGNIRFDVGWPLTRDIKPSTGYDPTFYVNVVINAH